MKNVILFCLLVSCALAQNPFIIFSGQIENNSYSPDPVPPPQNYNWASGFDIHTKTLEEQGAYEAHWCGYRIVDQQTKQDFLDLRAAYPNQKMGYYISAHTVNIDNDSWTYPTDPNNSAWYLKQTSTGDTIYYAYEVDGWPAGHPYLTRKFIDLGVSAARTHLVDDIVATMTAHQLDGLDFDMVCLDNVGAGYYFDDHFENNLNQGAFNADWTYTGLEDTWRGHFATYLDALQTGLAAIGIELYINTTLFTRDGRDINHYNALLPECDGILFEGINSGYNTTEKQWYSFFHALANDIHGKRSWIWDNPSGEGAEELYNFLLEMASTHDAFLTLPYQDYIPPEFYDPNNSETNAEAVAAVAAGDVTEANAGWWGWTGTDDTTALQAAFDSLATTIVISDMGTDWVSGPLTLPSNKTITMQAGAVILAKAGAFPASTDCLMKGTGTANLTINGAAGSGFQMNKPEYNAADEHRHCFSMLGCSDITLTGLKFEASGGDGIYVGANAGTECRDIIITNCVSHDNHRQGLSVISVNGLTVTGCTFSDTDGHAPEAGIDIEPNLSDEVLQNILIDTCTITNNSGYGLLVDIHNLTSDANSIDIKFVDCTIAAPPDIGMVVTGIGSDLVAGKIEFETCTVSDTNAAGIWIAAKEYSLCQVEFDNCTLDNVDMSNWGRPIRISCVGEFTTGRNEINFINLDVLYDYSDYFMQIQASGGCTEAYCIYGTIDVIGTGGATVNNAVPYAHGGLTISDLP